MKLTSLAVPAIALAAISAASALAWYSTSSADSTPPTLLKEAKLIIEHNATDNDTGFQAFVDSEGWKSLDLKGPKGTVLSIQVKNDLGRLGLTELFFETVEPANADVPIEKVLAALPAGDYTFSGRGQEAGESTGKVGATATLSHRIPAGPQLQAPVAGAEVAAGPLRMSWEPVTKSIRGEPVKIVAYQLIVEVDGAPAPKMIGKFGLSMYLSPETTSITLPEGFLKPGTKYLWEVLAIEESGNQTLSSSDFRTR